MKDDGLKFYLRCRYWSGFRGLPDLLMLRSTDKDRMQESSGNIRDTTSCTRGVIHINGTINETRLKGDYSWKLQVYKKTQTTGRLRVLLGTLDNLTQNWKTPSSLLGSHYPIFSWFSLVSVTIHVNDSDMKNG